MKSTGNTSHRPSPTQSPCCTCRRRRELGHPLLCRYPNWRWTRLRCHQRPRHIARTTATRSQRSRRHRSRRVERRTGHGGDRHAVIGRNVEGICQSERVSTTAPTLADRVESRIVGRVRYGVFEARVRMGSTHRRLPCSRRGSTSSEHELPWREHTRRRGWSPHPYRCPLRPQDCCRFPG